MLPHAHGCSGSDWPLPSPKAPTGHQKSCRSPRSCTQWGLSEHPGLQSRRGSVEGSLHPPRLQSLLWQWGCSTHRPPGEGAELQPSCTFGIAQVGAGCSDPPQLPLIC